MALPVIHYVNFHSEGAPHDHGLALGGVAKEVESIVKSNPGPIQIHMYTPRKIISEFGEEAKWTVHAYDDSCKIAKGFNRSYHRVGMGAWRAFLMHQVMLKAAPGDMVFFHDANLNHYPGIRFPLKNVRNFAKMICELWEVDGTPPKNRVFSPMHICNHAIAKKEVLDFLAEDGKSEAEMREFARATAGRARLIAAENNEHTRGFFGEVSELCKTRSDLLVSSEGSDRGYFKDEPFLHHCAEQALFNAYAWKSGVFHSELPLFKIGPAVGNKDWGHGNDSGYHALTRYLDIVKRKDESVSKV